MSGIEAKTEGHHERERTPEFHKNSAHEHHDRLRDEFESQHNHENDHGHEVAKAHAEALESASSREEVQEAEKRREPSPAERRGPITKKELDRQFNHTMNDIREEMSTSSRTFSKFIHNKAVEKTSEIIGATIARPNALLAGAIGSFTLTLGVYLFAKNMGYQLSGFEPIAAFLIGWLAGQLYDYFQVMITGKKDL